MTRCDIRNWPELGTAGKLSSPTMAILSPQGVGSPKTKRFLTGLHFRSQRTLHFPYGSPSELISAIQLQGQDVHMPILGGLQPDSPRKGSSRTKATPGQALHVPRDKEKARSARRWPQAWSHHASTNMHAALPCRLCPGHRALTAPSEVGTGTTPIPQIRNREIHGSVSVQGSTVTMGLKWLESAL